MENAPATLLEKAKRTLVRVVPPVRGGGARVALVHAVLHGVLLLGGDRGLLLGDGGLLDGAYAIEA